MIYSFEFQKENVITVLAIAIGNFIESVYERNIERGQAMGEVLNGERCHQFFVLVLEEDLRCHFFIMR